MGCKKVKFDIVIIVLTLNPVLYEKLNFLFISVWSISTLF
jgi:hypothetical protein